MIGNMPGSIPPGHKGSRGVKTISEMNRLISRGFESIRLISPEMHGTSSVSTFDLKRVSRPKAALAVSVLEVTSFLRESQAAVSRSGSW